MTDKEMIVDGVNVAGCRYLFDDTAYKHSKTTCSITLKDCKYLGNNCYYKQLQRTQQQYNQVVEQNKSLQQEYKNLKEDYAELEQRHNDSYQEFLKLKQECAWLNIENKDKINMLEEIIILLYPDATDDERCQAAFNVEFIEELQNKLQILKDQSHSIFELTKYLEEIASLLGLGRTATTLGESTIEYWAVLTSSINEKIKHIQQECEELKKKKNYMQFGYKQAIEKIEKILKYYVTSSMGVKNIDGTFSLKGEKEAIILNYDPRKAREGLDIINEVKDAD